MQILVKHDPALVFLALGICLLTSAATLSLYRHARAFRGRELLAWTICAAIATGCGFWAALFVAGAAYSPVVLVTRDIWFSEISLIIGATVSGVGLLLGSQRGVGWSGAAGGAVLGFGIALIHYTGVLATTVPGRYAWAPTLIIVSIVFCAFFSAVALALAKRRDGWKFALVSVVSLSLAIISLHAAAIYAIDMAHGPTDEFETTSVSPEILALVIANIIIPFLSLCLAAVVADRKFRKKDHEIAMALDNMMHGLVMFDRDGRLIMWNRRYVQMYGMSPEYVREGLSHRDLLIHRKKLGLFSGDVDEYCRATIDNVALGVPWTRILDLSDERTIEMMQRPLPGGGWVSTHEDITDRVQSLSRIEHLAHHDALTGLANRVAFNRYLFAEMEKAAREGRKIAVLCIDLDRFKEVNDVFGHLVGDGFLRTVAARFTEVAEDAFISRLGGDEFILVLTDDPEPERLKELAERLQAATGEEIDVDGCLVQTGLSIGIAVYPADGATVESLLANLDAALYRAKRDGRGFIRFFNADMDKEIRERRLLQRQLCAAVDSDQMKLFYQPQATTSSGEIVGFEGLARWHNSARGSVDPDVFIPLAEDNGLIIQMGEWALRTACREAVSWNRPLQIAVNISPVQFRHGDLPALVEAVLSETGLEPHRLELEVTEGAFIDDFSRATSMLRRIKALGAKIVMDDFGTGYSSLSYLQSFPFDKIKIDRSFVRQVDKSPELQAIVRAVIHLARGLSLPVLAEGVETEKQRAFLEHEGCDEVQGFLIGRPEFIDFYAAEIGKAWYVDNVGASEPEGLRI